MADRLVIDFWIEIAFCLVFGIGVLFAAFLVVGLIYDESYLLAWVFVSVVVFCGEKLQIYSVRLLVGRTIRFVASIDLD